MSFEIRPYRSEDFYFLYDICLQTADNGKDARLLFSDKNLIGNYYAAPYAVFEQDVCFIVTENDLPCGYIIGCKSSRTFAEQCEQIWFPVLREQYPLDKVGCEPLTQSTISLIHHGYQPRAEYADYPAHLHINLLATAQGQGLGKRLMATFISNLKKLHISGVHLEVSRGNAGAISFYEKMGFKKIAEFESSIGYGLFL